MRGIHPSGIGIDRDRRGSHLTAEERDYLERQSRLAFLNLLDPHLVGFSSFGGREPGRLRWNATLRHQLTSFGYTVDTHFYLGRGDLNARLTVHSYFNDAGYSPGLELALFERPQRIAGLDAELSARTAVWLQPRGQQFRTADRQAGGLVGVDLALRRWRAIPYVSLTAKTEGWVAGQFALEDDVSVVVGLRFGGSH